jgi:hypothetical protein
MFHKNMIVFGSFVVFTTSIAAYAADPVAAQDAKEPAAQAIESVDKNLEKNPDNKGLKTAQQKLVKNKEKRADRHVEKQVEHQTQGEHMEKGGEGKH